VESKLVLYVRLAATLQSSLCLIAVQEKCYWFAV